MLGQDTKLINVINVIATTFKQKSIGCFMLYWKVTKACRANGDDYEKVVYRLVVVDCDGCGWGTNRKSIKHDVWHNWMHFLWLHSFT